MQVFQPASPWKKNSCRWATIFAIFHGQQARTLPLSMLTTSVNCPIATSVRLRTFKWNPQKVDLVTPLMSNWMYWIYSWIEVPKIGVSFFQREMGLLNHPFLGPKKILSPRQIRLGTNLHTWASELQSKWALIKNRHLVPTKWPINHNQQIVLRLTSFNWHVSMVNHHKLWSTSELEAAV